MAFGLTTAARRWRKLREILSRLARWRGGRFPREPLAATWEKAYARMRPFRGRRHRGVDRSTLEGKVMCGYQGWFLAKGDGSGMDRWIHYGANDEFNEENCNIDYWPDMSEAGPDECYPTDFRLADGSRATVFSSYHPTTVDRHFRWMAEYGIDGAFLQRFGTELRYPQGYDRCNAILDYARRSANRHGRTWAVMYDLTSLPAGGTATVIEDWKRLRERMKIGADAGYQWHRGKPLVAVWGVGFAEDRKYTLEECARLVDFLKDDPVYGGNAVMLGVPYGWREQVRDAVTDSRLHEVIRRADIVSPWAVGRYRTVEEFRGELDSYAGQDMAWCRREGLDYLPVVFPGFRWRNLRRMQGGDGVPDEIPRGKGAFFQGQGDSLIDAGATMLYVAMFDEMDEGTAIFKCTNHPPVGKAEFGTFEGLPADAYLRMTGGFAKRLERRRRVGTIRVARTTCCPGGQATGGSG